MAKFNYKSVMVVLKEKMLGFEKTLSGLFAEGNDLDAEIQKQLKGLKHG
nr:hypothetical protein [uncultured Pedobacter sp.]